LTPEYWHIGETPMRLADRMLIRVMTHAFVRVGAWSVPGPHCGSLSLDCDGRDHRDATGVIIKTS